MKLLFIVISFFAFFGVVNAHVTGASFENTIGEYVVDVGYDPAQVQAGDRLVLDFTIKKDGKPVDFDTVWVRIKSSDTTLLATGIARAELGATTLLYNVPKDVRELSISTRFEKGEDWLAVGEFSLPALKPESSSYPNHIALSVSAATILLGIVFARRYYPHT